MWLCVFLTQYLHFGGGKYPNLQNKVRFCLFIKYLCRKLDKKL